MEQIFKNYLLKWLKLKTKYSKIISKTVWPLKVLLFKKDLSTSLYGNAVFHGHWSSSLVAMELTYNRKFENWQLFAMSLQVFRPNFYRNVSGAIICKPYLHNLSGCYGICIVNKEKYYSRIISSKTMWPIKLKLYRKEFSRNIFIHGNCFSSLVAKET